MKLKVRPLEFLWANQTVSVFAHECVRANERVRTCAGVRIFVQKGAGKFFRNVRAGVCVRHFFGADVRTYILLFFCIILRW